MSALGQKQTLERIGDVRRCIRHTSDKHWLDSTSIFVFLFMRYGLYTWGV